MKYWRGYLVAAIMAAISGALLHMAEKYTVLVDMVFPYVTRTIQNFLAVWSSGTDLLLWQVAAIAIIVALMASIVLMILLRWNPIQWVGWVMAVIMSIYCLHTCIYGLNYHAGPLADDVRLTVTDYTLKELEEATIYYRDQANALATQIPRDGRGEAKFSNFDTLAKQAGTGFEVLTYEYSYSVFAGEATPVKELGFADMYTSMGITGVTMGITGEAAVNPQIPDVALPFTMCHEMAHRMCIAIERDANFAGFLACRVNPNPQFQYSAYFMAYRYCYNALASVGTPDAAAAAARISRGVCREMQRDLDGYSEFFSEHKDDSATEFADDVNDLYLTTSGDKDGVGSYSNVCDLLVSWHIQEIVIPAQREENVSTFDPYDETQVDLSGIVGALPEEDE
ncbi:MAG: DUF3810 domain-containing protein [Oscillospiraceae bacterium]|nr:DUF3810 domain-containing protein [Oscillospiraceae bacterium]